MFHSVVWSKVKYTLHLTPYTLPATVCRHPGCTLPDSRGLPFFLILSIHHRLSQEALKSFFSKEVLEKYSFLFKQKHENSAPDGSNLEPWLQALLGQMQTSIEQHVNAAMDGSAM